MTHKPLPHTKKSAVSKRRSKKQTTIAICLQFFHLVPAACSA